MNSPLVCAEPSLWLICTRWGGEWRAASQATALLCLVRRFLGAFRGLLGCSQVARRGVCRHLQGLQTGICGLHPLSCANLKRLEPVKRSLGMEYAAFDPFLVQIMRKAPWVLAPHSNGVGGRQGFSAMDTLILCKLSGGDRCCGHISPLFCENLRRWRSYAGLPCCVVAQFWGVHFWMSFAECIFESVLHKDARLF